MTQAESVGGRTCEPPLGCQLNHKVEETSSTEIISKVLGLFCPLIPTGRFVGVRGLWSLPLISEDEYKSDIADLEARYKPQEKRSDFDWTKRANEIVDLAQEFVTVMSAKDQIQSKRAILTRLGSNIVWDDEKLSIYFPKPIQALFKGFDEMKSLNEEFEPKMYQVPQGSNEKTEPKDPVFSTMLRR